MKTTFVGFNGLMFDIGDRVQLHPGTDLWMRGAKFGTVIGQWRGNARVKLDKIRHVVTLGEDVLRPAE